MLIYIHFYRHCLFFVHFFAIQNCAICNILLNATQNCKYLSTISPRNLNVPQASRILQHRWEAFKLNWSWSVQYKIRSVVRPLLTKVQNTLNCFMLYIAQYLFPTSGSSYFTLFVFPNVGEIENFKQCKSLQGCSNIANFKISGQGGQDLWKKIRCNGATHTKHTDIAT